MAMMQGIPPELMALLSGAQGQPQGGNTPQSALLEAIQNAMSQRLRTPNPDLASPASLTDGMRQDDSRRYYPPMTPESMATDTPPPPPSRDSIDTGEGTYEQRPAEDKAAQMAQDAVEGKGTKYPQGQNDPTDANNFDDREMARIKQMVENEDEAGLEGYGLTLDQARKMLAR